MRRKDDNLNAVKNTFERSGRKVGCESSKALLALGFKTTNLVSKGGKRSVKGWFNQWAFNF